MKVAIWVENGMTQLVLTPENDWEKSVTRTVADGDQKVQVMRGSFYECRGGWVRQGTSDDSLIMKVDCRETDEHGLSTVDSVVDQ